MIHYHNKTSYLWGLLVIEGSFILFFLALAPCVSSAQTASGTSLPPDALDAFNKGVIAAKQTQNYPLAIRYFQDARKLAPGAPMIYLNLGLAESKIPGRELRAIAWLAAYLEANPTAPNAAVVRAQIDTLDVKSQANLSRMIKAVQDVANKMSDTKILQDVAVLWAETGDFASARRAADLIQDEGFKSFGLGFIAEAQAESGDITGAQKTADLVNRVRAKSGAQEAIAAAQVKAGDIAGAQRTTDLIQDGDFKDWALELIAQAQAATGNIAGAQKTSEPIQDGFHKIGAQTSIAEAQINAKDLPGAKETCASAVKIATLIQDVNIQTAAFEDIIVAQADAGDSPGAQKTAELIREANEKSFAYKIIVEAQIRKDDISDAQETLSSAQKTSNLILDAAAKNETQKFIVETQTKVDHILSSQKGLNQLSIVEARIKAGDINGALRTAGLIVNDSAKFAAISVIAGAQTRDGDLVGAQKTIDLVQASQKDIISNFCAMIRLEKDKTKASAYYSQIFVGSHGEMQDEIVYYQLQAGDVIGAQKTAALIQDLEGKDRALQSIAKAQLESGDITGALATADLVHDERGKSWLQNTIAKAQIKAGDIVGAQKTRDAAQKTANLIGDADEKTSTQDDIATDQNQAAPKPIRSDWIDKLEDGNQSNDCALNTEPFLDPASYLKSLPSLDTPKKMYDLFANTTQRIVKAQKAIDEKLKLQTKR